nr:MAG TPA: hypothetical protein [Caudoviricetes sp.]
MLNLVTTGNRNIKPRFWLKIPLRKQSTIHEIYDSNVIDVIQKYTQELYLVN